MLYIVYVSSLPILNLPHPGRFWISRHSPVIFSVPVIPVPMVAALQAEGAHAGFPFYRDCVPQMAHTPRIGHIIRWLPLETSTAFLGGAHPWPVTTSGTLLEEALPGSSSGGGFPFRELLCRQEPQLLSPRTGWLHLRSTFCSVGCF